MAQTTTIPAPPDDGPPSFDTVLADYLGDEIVEQMLRPSPVPRFASETERPPAKAGAR
jgi:hypothetical protein